MPSAVAARVKSARLGLYRVTTGTSYGVPSCRAALSCAAVSGAGAWMSHPDS